MGCTRQLFKKITKINSKIMNKKKNNLKQYFNPTKNQRFFSWASKGISTPVAIFVVSLVVVAAGVLIWQFWPEEEALVTPSPSPSPAIHLGQKCTTDQDCDGLDCTIVNCVNAYPACEDGRCICKCGGIEESFDETAGWETYTNIKYGFEFKYPDGYETKEIPRSTPTGLKMSIEKGSIMVQEIDNSIINIDLPEDCMFNSDTLEEKNMLSFIDTKEINGIDFYCYKNYPEYIGGYCGMSMGCLYQDIYRTLHNDNCYQIVYERYDRSFIEGNPYGDHKVIGDVEEVPEIFDQILSTFKFID